MTPQTHEILILNGDVTFILEYEPPLPVNHPRVVIDDDWEEIIFSSCWRHYVGTWEIKDGRFFLVKLTDKYKIIGTTPIFADWFTGEFSVPQGEYMYDEDDSYGSPPVYEQELNITIENGVVAKSKTIDNRNKKRKTSQ